MYLAINLNVNPASMSAASRAMFDDFSFINTNATDIHLRVRGTGNLEESWSFFASQPAPTPPP